MGGGGGSRSEASFGGCSCVIRGHPLAWSGGITGGILWLPWEIVNSGNMQVKGCKL